MRVAFAHYSSSDDISGVTSWLVRLAKRLDADGAQVAIHLQHLGDDDPEGASIRKQLAGSGIFISAVACHQNLSRDVGETLSFINRWQPTVFLPQCKNHHYVAAAIAGEAGLPWVLTLHSDDPDYWNVLKALPPPLPTTEVKPSVSHAILRRS